jgi:hypothetical protein
VQVRIEDPEHDLQVESHDWQVLRVES